MARVKISDVAREAGVSLGTVSNAINHPERVRPDTLALVNEAIDRLGYLPNQTARLLAGGVNAVIGLVLPRLNHGCSLQIANGARNEANRSGYDLVIMNTDDDQEVERRYLRFCVGMQLAGVLVQPSTYQVPRPLRPLPVPVVFLSAPDVPDEALSVSADYAAQGRLIAEHVLSRGATHIAVVGEASRPPLAQRLEGVCAVAAEHPEVHVEVINRGNRYGSSDGARLGAKLTRREPSIRPDAIIGLADTIAAGAVAGVQAAGCAVPDDIMVAGCDGNPLAWGGSVSLTTCSPAGYEIGRKGVQMLVAQINAEREAEAAPTTGVPSAAAAEAMRREWYPSALDYPGIAPVALDASAEAEIENRHEFVRPFLLERASTMGADAVQKGTLGSIGAFPSTPELDVGSYL